MEKYRTNKVFETQLKIERDNLLLDASKKISNLIPGKMPLGGAANIDYPAADKVVVVNKGFLPSESAGNKQRSDRRLLFDGDNDNKDKDKKEKSADYRLTFIKNMQLLMEKNDQAEVIMKTMLSNKKKKVLRSKIKNAVSDSNAEVITYDHNNNYYNNEYNNNGAQNDWEKNNYKNLNNNNENAINNFYNDSRQNYYVDTTNNYYNIASNSNENAQFPNVKNNDYSNLNYNDGSNHNQVKNSMYMTNVNGNTNFNNFNNMLKTTYDFKDKPYLMTTINDSTHNTIKGNLLYTGFPIFKVDYSQNFNLNCPSKSINNINNFNHRYSNNNLTNKSVNNLNCFNQNDNNINVNTIIERKFEENNTKPAKLQNLNNLNLNNEKNENNTDSKSNTNSYSNKNYNYNSAAEANPFKNQIENNNNNNNENNYTIKSSIHANENFLPQIKIENNSTYAKSFKHPMQKNELFTLYNSNSKKKTWANNTNNFKLKSFSNSTNLYDTTVSENINSNFHSNKNNPNSSSNNNLTSNLNLISSKNVLIGTTMYNNSNLCNFSNFSNFNNTKKQNKQNIKLHIYHPTLSTEENEVFSNLCGYNKYELKMEEKSNKENINNHKSKDEFDNLKKNLSRNASWENSYYNYNNNNTNDFNNSSKDIYKIKNGLNNSVNNLKNNNNNLEIKTNNSGLNKNKNFEKIKSSIPTKLWKLDIKTMKHTSPSSKISEQYKQNYFDEPKNNNSNTNNINLYNNFQTAYYNQNNSEKNLIQNLNRKEAERKFNIDLLNFDDKKEQKKEENEINVFNSTKEIFKRAENSLELSSKTQNKFSKRYLNCKYNINGNSIFQHYNPDEFIDEQQVCFLIEQKIIKLCDIPKLNLIPNFNKSYFFRLMNLDQKKFNNPLLEIFKTENPKDTKYSSDELIMIEMDMDVDMLNKQMGNEFICKAQFNNDEENINNENNNMNNLYREIEVISNMDEIVGEINIKEQLKVDENEQNEQLKTEKEEDYDDDDEEEKNENNSDKKQTNNLKGENYIKEKENYNEEQEKGQEEVNENQELVSHYFDNEEVGELQGTSNNIHSSLNNNIRNLEKMLTETIASENSFNNLGKSTLENYNNFNRINPKNKLLDDYLWDQADTRVPYNWGTKYSNTNIAPKKFLNLNNNMANAAFSLKSKLLPDVIIDQHKISEKRKENLISIKENTALVRTQNVFSKFIQRRKGNVEKK